MSLFNEWFEHYSKKPVKFSAPGSTETSSTTGVSFSDRITQDFQLKQHDDLVAKWSARSMSLCEKAQTKFMNVLTFPNGGWMRDQPIKTQDSEENLAAEVSEDEDEIELDEAKREEKLRKRQMTALRKLYVPYVCFVLCEMLNKLNWNKELIRLGDMIACENYKLYELFDQSQLKCVLIKFADASIKLIDDNVDFLGYQ
jgi:hypothetical protein